MLNKVMLIGNLGGDPEVKELSGDKKVANVTLATSEKYGGEKHTEWHRLVLWNKQAELAGQYLKKGALIFLEGKIQTKEWEKDGQKRWTTEVNVWNFKMLDRKPKNTKDDIFAD